MILDNFHYGVCACVALFLLIMIVKSVLVEPSEPTCSSQVTECSVEVQRRFHGDRGEPKPKRRKLCRHDHASLLFLDDSGVGLIDQCSLQAVWASVRFGNINCAFHSEAADILSVYNRGVAHSRNAETLERTIYCLQGPGFSDLINPVIYEPAMKEAATLLPFCSTLNCKNSLLLLPGDSLSRRTAVIEAAGAVYDWLHDSESVLRRLISAFSGGGLFYVTHVHAKVNQAYVTQQSVSKDEYTSECLARLS